MRKGKNYAAVIAAGYLMVIWISLKIAPFTSEGLLSVLQNMGIALNGHPFKFNICEETGNTVLVMTIVYLIAIVYFFASMKNKRPGEEYGSAKWGDVKALQKSYLQDESTDRILSAGMSSTPQPSSPEKPSSSSSADEDKPSNILPGEGFGGLH